MGISTQTIISNEHIIDYIPQRAPIIMVDEFLGVEDTVSRSALTIAEDNIFVDDGKLTECGVIEHIAQSAALRMGYLYKSQGKDVPVGFIGSVNKFAIGLSPRVGDRLLTDITIEQELMNISLISAIVCNGDEKIAECKMKIFLQE